MQRSAKLLVIVSVVFAWSGTILTDSIYLGTLGILIGSATLLAAGVPKQLS